MPALTPPFLRLRAASVRRLAVALGCLLMLGSSQPARAEDPSEALRAERFSGYITQAAALCFAVPARQCIQHAFSFADRDEDKGLSPAELTEVDLDVRAWWERSRSKLPGQVNFAIGLGLLTTQYAGHSYFVSAWDEDGDGVVSMDELTADLTLDGRSLPLLLQDEQAVDWTSVRGRLGRYGSLLDRLRAGS